MPDRTEVTGYYAVYLAFNLAARIDACRASSASVLGVDPPPKPSLEGDAHAPDGPRRTAAALLGTIEGMSTNGVSPIGVFETTLSRLFGDPGEVMQRAQARKETLWEVKVLLEGMQYEATSEKRGANSKTEEAARADEAVKTIAEMLKKLAELAAMPPAEVAHG